MATHAAVASWRVLTATVGAGSLMALVDVCADPVEESVSGLTGHTAVRALAVDALLTRTLEGVITLIHICAGVAAELVTKATDTPVAARRVVTAAVAAGIVLALVHILTAGLLVAAPVSRRANTPVAASCVHTLPHWTHSGRLRALVHILAVRALRVELVTWITHTGVFSAGLIDAASASTNSRSALTHTSHCLDSARGPGSRKRDSSAWP